MFFKKDALTIVDSIYLVRKVNIYIVMDPYLSWLEHPAHNRAVAGSSPAGSTTVHAWRNWQTH